MAQRILHLRTTIFYLIISTTSAVVLSGCVSNTDISSASGTPPQTMPYVDLQRYMGTWYDIASFPAPFQTKNCVSPKAHYQRVGNKIKVTNICHTTSGKLKIAHGSAVIVPNTGNSKLKITFFWPFRGNYWILYVSPDYQTAIVGTPNRKYLWFLAKTKSISKKTYLHLVQIAQQKGYPAAAKLRTRGKITTV